MNDLKVFTGNAHPELARAVCQHLGIPTGQADVFQFPNENIFVRILENVRSGDVFIIQPICSPVSQNLVELLIMLDAFRRASADRVTAVVPYYGYGRTDKKDQPRVPITARLIADLITVAGAHRVLTMDLHAGQIQGFFNIPVDELTAMFILSGHFRRKRLSDVVVVATDVGISKKARDFATLMEAPLAIMEKRRDATTAGVEAFNLIGEVRGMQAITFDDEVDTAASLVQATTALEREGATEIYSCCTHPVFSGPASSRIAESPIRELAVTDTIPVPPDKKTGKVTVLSIAPLLAEAISRIHTGSSVGELFQRTNNYGNEVAGESA
ncbi:MAG: ribose-phosphate pyrophosphokinase [Dehalococcoidia bacterium]